MRIGINVNKCPKASQSDTIEHCSIKLFAILSLLPVFCTSGQLFAVNTGYIPVETGLPSGLPNDNDYKKGLLNVLKYDPPGALGPTTGNGITDDSDSLQAALDAARDANLVCYIPSGTYLVSKTLSAVMQNISPHPASVMDREHPATIIGDKAPNRPVLLAAPGAFEGTLSGGTRKALLWIWAEGNGYTGPGGHATQDPEDNPEDEQSNASYYHTVRGLNIDLANNVNAVGIHFNGAQGCTLEDVTIWSSTNTSFYAGIEGGIAAGGGMFNIKVVGGKHGLYGFGESKFTILSGAEFINQTTMAIKWKTASQLVVTGFKFQKSFGPVITLQAGGNASNSINLVDGIIEVTSGSNQVAVDNVQAQGFSMRDVYIKGAAKLVKENSSFSWTATSDNDWTLVNEYAYANGGMKNIINGGALNSNEYRSKTDAVAAPNFTALKWNHVWDDTTFPSVGDSDLINAKESTAVDVRGTGGTWDDAPGIQALIDDPANAGKTIYLPRGDYRIGSTITLKAGTKLLGSGKMYARIRPLDSWANSAPAGTSLITTEDDANATTILSDIYVGCLKNQCKFNFVHWKAGKQSILRGVLPYITDPFGPLQSHNSQLFKVSGNGGGRWYAIPLSRCKVASGHANYRSLLVDGTSQPLSFYGLDPEHVGFNLDCQIEFRNASNVQVFQLKAEAGAGKGWITPLKIIGCDNVIVTGTKGVVELNPGRGMIEVIDSENYAIYFVDSSKSAPEYYMVVDQHFNDTVRKVNSSSIAGLIRRGNPTVNDHGIGNGGSGNNGGSLTGLNTLAVAGPLYSQHATTGSEVTVGGNADAWDFENITGEEYRIKRNGSNNYIDFAGTNYGAVTLESGPGGNNRVWIVTDIGGGLHQFENKAHAGFYLFKNASNKLVGANGCNTWVNSKWTVTATSAPTPNQAPSITAIVDADVNENETLNVNLTANDPDNDPITFSILDLPAFGTLTDNGNGTGTISFSPGYSASGSYPITVTVSDENDGNDNESFTLTVNNVNRAPSLTPITDKNINESATLNVSISANDPDGDPITLAASGLPGFSTLIDNGTGTGTIAFNPNYADSGTYLVTVTASDGNGGSANAPFTLIVDNVNRAPILDPISGGPFSVEEGASLILNISASDPDGDPLILTAIAPGMPFATTSFSAGFGTVTFDPIAGDAGVYSVTIMVDDGSLSNDSDSETISLTVNPPSGGLLSGLNTLEVGGPLFAQHVSTGTGVTAGTSANNWDFVHVTGEEYRIKRNGTNDYIECASTDWTPVTLETGIRGDNQIWIATDLGEGLYHLENKSKVGFYLFKNASDTLVGASGSSGWANSKWTITPSGPPTGPFSGLHTIQTTGANNYACNNVSVGDIIPGDTTNSNNTWEFEYVSGDDYRIKIQGTSNYIDLGASGANCTLQSGIDGDTRIWTIIPNGSEYNLYNKAFPNNCLFSSTNVVRGNTNSSAPNWNNGKWIITKE